MASIKDLDVGEKFSSRLEEIRTKLLSQAMGEVLNEATVEFCQAHKQYMKSVLGETGEPGRNPRRQHANPTQKGPRRALGSNPGPSCCEATVLTTIPPCCPMVNPRDTCSKKCREDETMFETIQAYTEELKRQNSILRERNGEQPEILGLIQDKESHKDLLIQKIEKLKQEQAKNRELIHSQNKANKDRLKNLNKIKEIFQEQLSLEIRKVQGEKLQFIFRNINHKNPQSAYTFLLRINEDGVYHIVSCDPPLAQMDHLERRLQETNNLSAFLANVRREFVALHNPTKTV
ncbi:kinetochore protein Spc25 isoform X1 [Neoarius graeffei]|uniref:kinetochore protein Spc25 isoform X1 n=1 Tax=Neoarius graeffei TaxID=443677 RepID=UPI00298CE93D|nr:kinetochore protein Spc25 isoform X1 [Neoarius graeffei]XP_060786077.1 kinetochore protein Spc25 isoform X1 [Neoarius graeffei]